MKNGRCPKCKSSDIYSGANIKMKSGTYGCNTIPLGGAFGSHVALDNYICAGCGYVESYISSEKGLQKVRERWERTF